MLTWGESAAPVRTAEATSAKARALNAQIGATVNYTSSDEVASWRLFYASDTEVFLISSNVIDSITAFGRSGGIPLKTKGAYENYTGAVDVFGTSYGELYNKNWANTNSTDTNIRAKATAYLCDSTNWTKYVGASAPSGTYAVGGPTKELLVRSWKASGQSSDSLTNLLADTTATTDGYDYDKPSALRDNNPIKSDILSGLYNTGDAHYWMASPNSRSLEAVGYVYYNYSCVGNGIYDNGDVGVRPVVSIPITEVSVSGTTVSIK